MRMVRRGLIWYREGPRPQDETGRSVVNQGIYDRCEERFFDQLGERLTEVPSIDRPLPSLPLCDCGCLLASPNEPCPACLVWAMKDAIRQSWRADEIRYSATQDYARRAA